MSNPKPNATPNLKFGTKKTITLEGAKLIAAAAHAEAQKNSWNMVIAVVDDGGHTIYLERMDNAQIGSVLIAQEKAAGAVRFKRATKAIEDMVSGGRTALLGLPGVIPIEGGVPLIVEGQVIGAIGVSGGTSTQDGLVAAAGLAVAEKMI